MRNFSVIPLSSYMVRLRHKGLTKVGAVDCVAKEAGLSRSVVYEYLKNDTGFIKIDRPSNTVTLLREVARKK